jgi:minor extracellular serine protease Vpr
MVVSFLRKWFTVVFLLASPLAAERVPDRYIVELSTESVAEHLARQPRRESFTGTVAEAHRARVHAEQQQARTLVERQQGVVLDRVQNIANALFVRIPDEQAAQLAALPGVRRVIPVRTFEMLLDRVVQVDKISDVWNEIGKDRAGAGVKIAIIDSGIDNNHPALQNASLPVPDSFPRVNTATDQQFTNHKVIVARSYVNLLPSRDPDTSARDRSGHGTALASIAAGQSATGPLASVAGIAPQAYLGNYKIFGTPGYNDTTTDDAILKAMDDAVADGMDIINLSLGSDIAPRLADDLEVAAVERASSAGVLVVVAAGNNGPDFTTIASPATAPSAIAVGAQSNGRTFAASVHVDGLAPMVAIRGSGTAPPNPLSGPLADVATLDSTGLAFRKFGWTHRSDLARELYVRDQDQQRAKRGCNRRARLCGCGLARPDPDGCRIGDSARGDDQLR